MNSPHPLSVIIAGGGIGGLTAGLCLKRAGLDVRIFEAAREVKPLGVGINLLPHSVRVLRDLGLQDALAATGIETAELIYLNKFGQKIWQEPRGIAAGYAVPQYSIHRGELQMILYEAALQALSADRVRTGATLGSFTQDSAGVSAQFLDRESGHSESVRGDVLIAADGIHSTVRRHYYPDEGDPRFSGRILWRSMTEGAPFLGGRSMAWAGHDSQKFVCYPVSAEAAKRGQAIINWIAELRVPLDSTPPRTDWNKSVEKSVFSGPFQDWKFPWLNIPELIEKSGLVYEFPMVDRDPVDRWTHGRVTLLGDAAHPMYPVGSNGASQAILDAEELAMQFQSQTSAEAALQAYDAARRPATSAIVLANRKGGPDRVLQLAEERAPNGFTDVHDVISREELEAISLSYKQTAGFDKDSVNRKAR
jgi:2-polyprenyl-6-methoxyphenol hydroxylase-like FAD-dependent oxidoreductase